MADDTNPVAVLEEQLSALDDTHNNLTGLVEKGSRMQMDLTAGGFDTFAEQVAKAFGDLSGAAEALRKVRTRIEVERNRLQNE